MPTFAFQHGIDFVDEGKGYYRIRRNGVDFE
jgi:hypothetical protein